MSNQTGLLQAIELAPEDDDVRLVYADWLEEHGSDTDRQRAELIRLQVRLASLDRDDRERLLLTLREQELLARNRQEWLADFPPWAKKWVEFRRGLPFHLATTAGQFLRRGKAFRKDHFIEGLTLDNARGLLAKLAGSRLLAGVRILAFGTGIPSSRFADGDLAALADCPDLGSLSRLDLSRVPSLETGELRQLLTSERLPNLRELRLSAAGTGSLGTVAARRRPGLQTLLARLGVSTPEECAALACSPGMAGLHTLDVSHRRLHDEGVAALAAGESLSQLERLNLDQNELRTGAVRALAESPYLRRLTHLSLEFCWFGEEGAALLADSPNFADLQHLNLDNTLIESAGLIRLARSQTLRSLRRLRLGGAAIDQAAADELARSPLLANLVDLRIDGPLGRMDPGALGTLLRSPVLGRLRFLSVGVNPMSQEIIAAVAESPHLTRLEGLFLSQAKLKDEHAEVLARSPNLTSVRLLDLSWNHIGEAGARALARSPYLDSLVQLLVGENPLEGSWGVETLSERFGERLSLRWRLRGADD